MADTTGLKQAMGNRGGHIARRLALDVERDLHEAAERHRKTGEMDRAIRVTNSRSSPTLFTVTADVPVIQAATTDRGARPHVIRPRRARALRFVMDGRVVYARVVNHPGNRPSRWFSKVLDEGHVSELLRRFVGR